ncbi:tetratricopeptide repeat protein [candidate division WWE3 bacterium]|uniref:Tetratricopeptide repeat protein n=1 Tax=candidate division WWE3 bacterium TaxID=2053526 RepID=A0A7X9HGK7_UNCKA|nr:tetratricopeptide repeat protein [candidate division WWE3 bacterium]
MTDDTFETLFLKAEYCRERGNPTGAIPMFNAAIEKAVSKTQIWLASLQIGLCFEHMGDYGQAEDVYESVLHVAQWEGNASVEMTALRHLLSIMVHDNRTLEAIQTGHKALAIMRSLPEPPPNAVWITHGLCKALKARQSPRDIVAKLSLQEFKELKYARKIGVPPLHYNVWLTGWLSDMAYAHVAIGWLFLFAALCVSIANRLSFRLKQFKTGNR